MNRLDKPVLMSIPKPMPTESGIHYRLEGELCFGSDLTKHEKWCFDRWCGTEGLLRVHVGVLRGKRGTEIGLEKTQICLQDTSAPR